MEIQTRSGIGCRRLECSIAVSQKNHHGHTATAVVRYCYVGDSIPVKVRDFQPVRRTLGWRTYGCCLECPIPLAKKYGYVVAHAVCDGQVSIAIRVEIPHRNIDRAGSSGWTRSSLTECSVTIAEKYKDRTRIDNGQIDDAIPIEVPNGYGLRRGDCVQVRNVCGKCSISVSKQD